MSLKNVIGKLRVMHGVPPGTVQFSWPSDLTLFDSPWAESVGLFEASFDIEIREDEIRLLSEEDILGVYQKTQDDAV